MVMATKEPSSLRNDCQKDVAPCTGKRGCRHKGKWEWYMVKHAVWRKACRNPYLKNVDTETFLCIACLEKRLGRELVSDDFLDAPIKMISSWDTEILINRKLSGHEHTTCMNEECCFCFGPDIFYED